MPNEPKQAECACRKALRRIQGVLFTAPSGIDGMPIGWNWEFDRIAAALATPCECERLRESAQWQSGRADLAEIEREEGRGSYEWDDARYQKEFTTAVQEIKAALHPLAKIAANWQDCPRAGAEVAQARIDLKAENARLRAELADYRDWTKLANGFAWAHENDCPRHNADEACTCGLDQFLARPRPTIESFRTEFAKLRAELAEAMDALSENVEWIERREAAMIAAPHLIIMGLPCFCDTPELHDAACVQLRTLVDGMRARKRHAAAILAKHKKPDSSTVIERAKFTPPIAWEDE